MVLLGLDQVVKLRFEFVDCDLLRLALVLEVASVVTSDRGGVDGDRGPFEEFNFRVAILRQWDHT